MGENDAEKQSQAGQLFENFIQASTFKATLQAFNILCRYLELDPLDHWIFYSKLKSKVNSWKAKALWSKLDKQANHKDYRKGKACNNINCLIIGGGPCGLRTAIELAFLGAKVVLVEKRDSFSRNNVLHLWPYTIHDLRALAAKKFCGKFCAGTIDHISIRQLQLILTKVALLLGVEIHVNVEFVQLLEPPEDQENQRIGWRAEVRPMDHPVSNFTFNIIVGADGRRNSLQGFRRKEFRGKLAIAITANFVNRNTTAEAKVEEISGVAFIFNQKFFQDLREETGIDLENIVYYKDNTHYFVMTAKKQSLLDKGVIIHDYIDTEMLLCSENVSQEALQSYAREAADFATNYQLPSLDFAINHINQPDVAMFDFTCMYASENAALVRERHSHRLLVALVGDSLLEPFWPMGTGCARGFLAALDTAWMAKRWAQSVPPLEILAERESIYRLLPQTTPENISKNFEQYTIDPGTRYPNLNSNCIQPHQVHHLYITTELKDCPLERANSIRKSIKLSRHESEIRPNRLLTWCQKQTEGYENVTITDLTSSWKSGLALCAIIHHFCPHLIDFDSLNEEDAAKNNQLAFDLAEQQFGISPITTGKEMVAVSEPDKLNMVMYLSKFYELFRGTPPLAASIKDREGGNEMSAAPFRQSNLFRLRNLSLPRKRTPKEERKPEENDTMSKRRKRTSIKLEENQAIYSRSNGTEMKNATNQNKVRSMATQLLAKFEENAPSAALRRQESMPSNPMTPPLSRGSVASYTNPRFAKPQDQTHGASRPPARQSQPTPSSDRPPRDPKHVTKPDGEAASAKPLALGSCSRSLSVRALSGVLQRLQRLEERFDQMDEVKITASKLEKMLLDRKDQQVSQMKNGNVAFPHSVSPPLLCHSGNPPACQPRPAHLPCHSQMTVGKVSAVIGAMAEVLVTLYQNDHRPKPDTAPPDRASLRKEFPQNLGGSDVCYFCNKRVYVMERLSADGKFFHRECFKCEFCQTTLRLGAYAFSLEEGKFYCKPHFAHCKSNNKLRKRRADFPVSSRTKSEASSLSEAGPQALSSATSTPTVNGGSQVAPGIIASFSRNLVSWPLCVVGAVLRMPKRLCNWVHGVVHTARQHLRDNAHNYAYLFELLSLSLPLLYMQFEVLTHMSQEAGQPSLDILIDWWQKVLEMGLHSIELI
uniref:F-actin monooxygenase n=1 Tax=Callorhinchus milii TaxID=7868 RepID=A0A4W3GJF8_CALMI